MHELPIVKQILSIVLRHAEENQAKKVTAVVLEIGEMHDLQAEWVERFFTFASRGTIAEGASIKVEKLPIICHCSKCNENFVLPLRTSDNLTCSVCGSDKFTPLTGKELFIKELEII